MSPPADRPKRPKKAALKTGTWSHQMIAVGPEQGPPAPKRAVRVSVAAVIVNEQGRILVGVRRGTVEKGRGRTAVPGGEMEFGESITQAVEREVLEETGLVVRAMPVSQVCTELFLVNHVRGEIHFVTIFVEARVTGGVLENREPKKCAGWEWLTFQQFSARLSPEAIEAWQAGRPHEDLCWLPVPQLSHYRDHLGFK